MQPEQVTQNERVELVNLYHLAQSALSDLGHVPTSYERMCWASSAWVKDNPARSIPAVRAYKALCSALS